MDFSLIMQEHGRRWLEEYRVAAHGPAVAQLAAFEAELRSRLDSTLGRADLDAILGQLQKCEVLRRQLDARLRILERLAFDGI